MYMYITVMCVYIVYTCVQDYLMLFYMYTCVNIHVYMYMFVCVLCRVVQWRHQVLRRKGYLKFYRKMRNVRRVPFIVVSIGELKGRDHRICVHVLCVYVCGGVK